MKVGPVTVPSAAIVVPPITVAKLPTAANLPFVAVDKSTEYARTLFAFGVASLIVNASLPTATVVSIAFTLYVVTPGVVVVSVSIVVLIPGATFTASCAAVFANSLTLFLPSSDKLLKFLSATLSTLLRVTLSRPKVTNPSAPVVIDTPDLGPSVVVVVSVAAVKFKPFFSFTVFAAVSATPFAR